jgi:hypothetical protein
MKSSISTRPEFCRLDLGLRGYGPSDAHHNDIGFNHVYTLTARDVGHGGIYTLAFSPAPLCTTTMSMTSSHSAMEAVVCTRAKVRLTS